MTLYVIAGHGAGDPGAGGYGFNEAERVRALADRIKALGGDQVTVLDTSRNWYADKGVDASLKRQVGNNPVIELHMDSGPSTAKGGHVIIKDGYNPDAYDSALAGFVAGMFPGRSQAIVGRGNLANINRAAANGINYRLLECCFISNKDDLTKFNDHMDDLARGILAAFGIEGDDEMTQDEKDKLNAIFNHVTATSDPTGRNVNINDHDHIKWIAAGQAKQNEVLAELGNKLDRIASLLEANSK